MGNSMKKVEPASGEDIANHGGILGIIANFLGLGKAWDKATGSAEAIFDIPQTIVRIMKWVAIGAAVLIGIFLLVFIWRFSRGNTPDIAGGVATIARMTPQGRALSMVM